MILNITSASIDGVFVFIWSNALELGHDDLCRFPNHVSQSVETASMGHTDNKSAGSFLNCGVDAEFEAWHERLATLKTEPLHRVEFLCHEGTPLMCKVESLVHVYTLSFCRLFELDRLELLTDPVANLTILDMHKLDADLATVSLFVGFDKVAKHPLLFSLNNCASKGHLYVELTVHVSLAEAICLGI